MKGEPVRLLWALIVNVWLLVWWPLRYRRSRRAAPLAGFLVLKLDGRVVEIAPRRRFWERGQAATSVDEVRKTLRLASADPRVRGLVVSFKHAALGAAVATSLREALLEWKQTGKALVAYLPLGMGTRELLIASAAEQIFLGHETWVTPLGFSAESPYFKRLLEHVGVEPDVFARGEFKTAAEFLTSDVMSAAQREQLGALLDESWERLLEGVAAGRGVPAERVKEWLDGSPYDAQDAARLGLVDGVLDDDELVLRLARGAGVEPGQPQSVDAAEAALEAARDALISVERYAKRRRLEFRPLRRPAYISVVELSGSIVSQTPGMPQLGDLVVDDEVCDLLEEVHDDRRARGVVLHIDSRGGSALASDRILRAVRRVASRKPVVAYLGNVAASGGYMIALGAQEMVAQPATVTGSIGVVAARVVVERLAQRVGVDIQRVTRGAHADMLSPFRHFSADERARFESLIEAGYQRFVTSVAEARGRSFEQIEPLARGRVWSARAARDVGLIDKLGGLEVALDSVRKKLGPKADSLRVIAVGAARMPSPLALLPGLSAAVLARARRGSESWVERAWSALHPRRERRSLSALGVEPSLHTAEAVLRALAASAEQAPTLWLWCDHEIERAV